MNRQILLDTETTGLETKEGHRIIEIGCVEMINRRVTGNNYHQYIQPNREIDEGALAVHGITQAFLADKPPFEAISNDFIHYIQGAELIIHNAPFDIGFLNNELKRINLKTTLIEQYCQVLDTLVMAREKHPGQRNSLDALCKRYDIDNSKRELHGALLDSRILADVYLAMTGGQVTLSLSNHSNKNANSMTQQKNAAIRRLATHRPTLNIIRANFMEKKAHEATLEMVKKTAGKCYWEDERH